MVPSLRPTPPSFFRTFQTPISCSPCTHSTLFQIVSGVWGTLSSSAPQPDNSSSNYYAKSSRKSSSSMKPSQTDEQKLLAYRVPTSTLCSPNPDFPPYYAILIPIYASLLHRQEQQRQLLTFIKCLPCAGYCLEVLSFQPQAGVES